MIRIVKKWTWFITIAAVLTSTIYLTVSANDYNNEYEKIGLVIEKFSVDISDECYDPEVGISVLSCDSNGMYVCIRNNVTLSDRYLFVDYAGNTYERDAGLPAIFSDGIAAINTDGVISTWDNNDNYGYIDENYNWIREPGNHIVSSASEGYVLIGDKGKQFLLDYNGRPCFAADRFWYNSPLSVTEIGKVFSKGKAVCEKNGRFCFVDMDLNCVEFAAKADGWESCDYSGGTAVITKSKPDDYAVGTEKYISEMYNSAGTCVYKHELSVSDDEYDSSFMSPKVLSNGYAIFPKKDNDAASESRQNKFPECDLIMVSPDGEVAAITDESFRVSNLQSLGANILFDELGGICYDMNFEKLLEPDNRNIYCCDLNGDVAVTVKQEEAAGEKVVLEFTVIHPREVELNRAVRVVDPDKVKPVVGKREVLTDCICIDNEAINFNLPPIEENDRILVPMRGIFEELGAEVMWDNDTNTATAVKDNIEIKITVDSDIMLKNGGQTIKLDAPARLVDDAYTYVPLRAVSEAFGCTVNWNEELRRADIILPQLGFEQETSSTGTKYYTYNGESYWFAKDFSEGMAAVSVSHPYTDKQYWGYINTQGELVIPYQFTEAGEFKNGTATVKSDWYDEYQIDVTGARTDGKERKIDTDLSITPQIYRDDSVDFGAVNFYGAKLGNEALFGKAYNSIVGFSEGYSLADIGYMQTDSPIFGVINTRGEMVLPFKYYTSDFDDAKFKDGIIPISEVGKGEMYFMDINGNNVFGDKTFNFARQFSEGFAAVKINDEYENIPSGYESEHNKWAYIDKIGEFVSDERYDLAESFKDGYANVMIDGKWHKINMNFEIVE